MEGRSEPPDAAAAHIQANIRRRAAAKQAAVLRGARDAAAGVEEVLGGAEEAGDAEVVGDAPAPAPPPDDDDNADATSEEEPAADVPGIDEVPNGAGVDDPTVDELGVDGLAVDGLAVNGGDDTDPPIGSYE